ncbi:HNH endonuclease signature motif containing protein, partial [uncultured Ornithinimicrobium sp.]|uniref:HNH endonuclease signature motif containing protein n=1 Tax=uncultured Ornithinimicrobium sp. TaxID=259307 RepID=UPI002598ACBE
MRAPVQLPRQEGPGESTLEQQLGLLLSFDPGPDLAEHVVHLELGAVRAAGGPGLLAPAGPGQAPPGAPAQAATGTVETGRTGVDGAVTTPADDGKPAEVRLRSVLAELGLDAGSVALLSSVATTLAAVRTGRPVAGLPATSTTRANRPTDDTGRDSDDGVRGPAADPGDGGESGVGAPDAAAIRRTGQGVLDRIEDLLDLGARLDGALVAAAGELTGTNARLLLAAKGRTDPAGLSPAARERWAARARSTTAHELSAATGWGIGQTRDLVAAATAPAAITTPVLAALGSSVVSWPLVRRAWRAATTAGLDVEATTHLAQVMFGTDPDQVAVERLTPTGTVSTLPWAHRAYHHALDREIAKLTAGTDRATRAARANARAARDATARLDDDGTATVTITTGPAQATALIDRLHTAARTARRHGDARTLAQLRADTACALLLHGTLPLPDQPGDPDQVSVQDITALAALLEGLPAATLNVITPWHLLPGTTSTAGRDRDRGNGDTGSGGTGNGGVGGHEHPHRCSTTPCPAAPPPRPGQPDAPPGPATTDGPADATSPPEEPSDQASPTAPVTGPPGDGQEEVLLAVAQATGTTPAFLHAPDVADLLTTPGTTLHRLVVDPLDGRCVERSTTAYQPDAHMRAQARAADGTCRAPGCTRPAIYTQLDHVHEHATGGATTLCNLECLCTTHHDLKTARHWQATIDAHRDVTWQTLLGRI